MTVADWRQPDVEQAYLRLPFAERDLIRRAATEGDSMAVPLPDLDILTSPGLGYVDSPIPAIPYSDGGAPLRGGGSSYVILVPHTEHFVPGLENRIDGLIPPGYGLDTLYAWRDGILRLTVLHAEPGI
jgi:hypothetical protein